MTNRPHQIEHDPENGVMGNCLQVAVAVLLGLDVDDVPHFCQFPEDPDGIWWWAYVGFLSSFDPPLRVVSATIDPRNPEIPERPCIVIGQSPRYDAPHAIVYFGGGDWHDPHPSGDGLLNVTRVEWLVELDSPH